MFQNCTEIQREFEDSCLSYSILSTSSAYSGPVGGVNSFTCISFPKDNVALFIYRLVYLGISFIMVYSETS